MAWVIAGQLEPHARSGVDASGWLWEIHRGDDARRVLVEVTGTAWAVSRGLADETREAIETKGESEVLKVLALDDPPRIIQCGTNGCHPLPPDEVSG